MSGHTDRIERFVAAIEAHTESVSGEIDIQATMLPEFRHVSLRRLADVSERRRNYLQLVSRLVQAAQDDGALTGEAPEQSLMPMLLNPQLDDHLVPPRRPAFVRGPCRTIHIDLRRREPRTMSWERPGRLVDGGVWT